MRGHSLPTFTDGAHNNAMKHEGAERKEGTPQDDQLVDDGVSKGNPLLSAAPVAWNLKKKGWQWAV